MSAVCLEAMHGRVRVLSKGPNWQHKASHKWGKSCPVETGLAGLAAMALAHRHPRIKLF